MGIQRSSGFRSFDARRLLECVRWNMMFQYRQVGKSSTRVLEGRRDFQIKQVQNDQSSATGGLAWKAWQLAGIVC